MSSRLFCESIRETVAKRSHGIAKSSHASRTGRELFAKVLNMLHIFVRQKSSQNRRQVIAYVANPSPTLGRRSQTHRMEVSAICTMRHICDRNKPFRDSIARHKTDKNSHERRETLALMSHDCRTVVRCSHECLMNCLDTLARMSHDCRANVVNIELHICRDHKVQCDRFFL